jgi:hypothetical protein
VVIVYRKMLWNWCTYRRRLSQIWLWIKYEDQIFNHPSSSKHDQGTFLKHKDSFLRFYFLKFFFTFSMTCLTFHSFFYMSNEIILFQILCRFLKFFFFFSLMKLKIVNFIQCEPCFINDSKFLEIWLFETFYIEIGHLDLVKFIHFIHLNT